MQNTKHTQGKWEVKTPNYSFQTIESKYGKVCTLSHQFGTDEAEANARLIAAAPELLEALDGMINRFAPNFNRENDEDAKALQKAYAAIIKAKGGTL